MYTISSKKIHIFLYSNIEEIKHSYKSSTQKLLQVKNIFNKITFKQSVDRKICPNFIFKIILNLILSINFKFQLHMFFEPSHPLILIFIVLYSFCILLLLLLCFIFFYFYFYFYFFFFFSHLSSYSPTTPPSLSLLPYYYVFFILFFPLFILLLFPLPHSPLPFFFFCFSLDSRSAPSFGFPHSLLPLLSPNSHVADSSIFPILLHFFFPTPLLTLYS